MKKKIADFIRILVFQLSKIGGNMVITGNALAYDGITFGKCDTFFCKEPTILTGGGDNFNAGFCFARFYDFDLFQSLIVANAVSGSYVKTGTSPDAASKSSQAMVSVLYDSLIALANDNDP